MEASWVLKMKGFSRRQFLPGRRVLGRFMRPGESGSRLRGELGRHAHGWRHHNSGDSGSYAAAFLKEAGTSSVTFFTTLAGEPATTQLDGTLRVTTLLAPTTPPAPIVTPLRIVTP
jgi:hypothetical protein